MTWILKAHTFIAATSSQYDPTTSAIDTTGADLLVVYTQTGPSLGASFSDSKSNTWTTLTPHNAATILTPLYCFPGASVGSGHTFHTTTGTSGCGIYVQAWAGSDGATAPIENGVNYSGSSDTSRQPGSITPPVDDEMIICGLVANTGTTPLMSGFTVSDSSDYNVGTGVNCAGMSYFEQVTAAAINPTWTWTGGSYGSAHIMAFKPGAGGGGGAVQSRMTTLMAG